MKYMDSSRPYDWLCTNFVEGMLTKARLIINFHTGTVPTKTMPEAERMTLLESSVDIIKRTHALAVDDRISDWVWYFRGYVQWHSLAIVVAELGWSRDDKFVTMAWNVLDDILVEWDTLYQTKKDDPAWTHVNDSIQRARKLRQKKKLDGALQEHAQYKKPRHSAPHDQIPAVGSTAGLTHSIANMRQPLQHRPAPTATMPPQQQPLQYVQTAQPYESAARTASWSAGQQNAYNYNDGQQYNNNLDGQTPQSQTSSGSPMSHEFNFDMDPYSNLNFDAFNHVFTDTSFDPWEHMQDVNMGFVNQNDIATANCGTWGGWAAQPNIQQQQHQQNVMPNYAQYPQG